MLGQDLDALISIPFQFEEVEMARQKSQRVKVKSKKTGSEAIITYRYWDAIVRNVHSDDYIILDEDVKA
jgi:hypothetical protein